jgi:DNA-binding response OmpR family regulator
VRAPRLVVYGNGLTAPSSGGMLSEMTLARRRARIIEQQVESTMNEAAIGVRTVLCVEDEPESRELLEESLAGHNLVFVSTAREAVTRLNASAFHGYVLDYWLPDWSGPALCREIRKVDPYGPVVFCTAAARESDRARALRAGASAYLCKPIEADVIRAKLRAFLTMAELESLRAKVEEERAVQCELERRLASVAAQAERGRELLASSIERTARAKALKAFIDAHGTRAHFEAWWPQVFGSVRANHEF